VSDHKYSDDKHKSGWPGIEKYKVIDLLDNLQNLPDTDIYDEPVRYFKANEKWTPIIFGWLTWLEEIAGWQIAEDDLHPGIQAIMKFEEGIEPIVTTPAELTTAIRDGLYQWTNDVAKQIISGRITDIAVDENGNIVPPSEGLEPLPEDDPLTPIDESKAASAGSALTVALGVNEFIGTLNTLFGADADPDTPLADAISLILYLYVVDAGMPAAITEYYADRVAGKATLAAFNVNNLAGHIYCNPFQTPEQSTLQFVAASLTITQENKLRYNELISQLEETQWNIWQNTGSNAPSTQYLAFPCEPIPDYSFTLQFDGISFNDSHIFKANHRYQIKATGYLLDPDGDVQDAWWHKQVGQPEVFDVSTFNIQVGGAIKIDPLVFETPYSTTHAYLWTLDMGTIDAGPQWTLSRHATMDAASTSPSGGILIEVHDVGELI